MPDWVVGFIVVACIAAVIVGAALGLRALDAPERNAQRLCIERGYIEALWYNTQSRYFCVGQRDGEWLFVPVEQLEAE